MGNMAERILNLPESYAERAFMGAEAQRVEGLASQIYRERLLLPVDEADRRTRAGVAMKMVHDLGEPRADMVGGLLRMMEDPARTVDVRKEIGGRLDLLAQAVYAVMRYGENDDLQDVLGQGSVMSIEEVLPPPLKGLGERVCACVFDPEGPVIKRLSELDVIRQRCDAATSLGRDALGKAIRRAYIDFTEMDVDGRHKAEMQMAMAYLSHEAEKLEPEDGDILEIGEKHVRGRVGGGKRGAYDGRRYGEPEGPMGRMGPLLIPEESLGLMEVVVSPETAKAWVTTTLVRMSEDPLFFASWWQGRIADQLVDMLATKFGWGTFTAEYAETRDWTYAVLSVLGMQEVDRNADANSDNYGQFAPPKEMAHSLHWDDGGEKYGCLRDNPRVLGVLQIIFEEAFDPELGWNVVKAFSSIGTHDSQNEYLKTLNGEDVGGLRDLLIERGVNLTGVSDDQLMAEGRLALAIFEVDWMPEWIRWANEKKRAFVEGRSTEDVPWLQAFTAPGVVNVGLATYDTFAYSGKLNTVVDEDGKEVKMQIGYDHPRILRPWDVAAGAKGSYRQRPEIVWAMERVLVPFIAKRLSTDEGRWVRASGGDIRAKNVLDRYLKYGKLMFELMGGVQALEFDNLTNMEKVAVLAANFWTGQNVSENVSLGGGIEVRGNPEFGRFLADLFALKTEAMFYPGYRSGADLVLNKIRGLDPFAGEKEKAIALEGVLGPNGNFAHGWVAEVRRIYGIDLLAVDRASGQAAYPQFVDAYMRVFMDTPDVMEARKMYRKAQRWLDQNRYLTLIGGGLGVVAAISGKR